MIDIIAIVILTVLMWKATTNTTLSDLMGCVLASVILYSIAKAIPILLIGGFTWPVSSNPILHWISGGIAIVSVGVLLIITAKKKHEHLRRW